MPLLILRQDIVYMNVDAIVSSVSQEPYLGVGVHSRIHDVAGPHLFLARQKLGSINVSEAFITPGYQLLANYVIHTHAPNYYFDTKKAPILLYQTYQNCLHLAKKHHLSSITFPLLSSGVYGYPKDEALEIAKKAIYDFLETYDLKVYLVVYDHESYEIAKKYSQKVNDYLLRNYQPIDIDLIDDFEDEEEDDSDIFTYAQSTMYSKSIIADEIEPKASKKKASLENINKLLSQSFTDLFYEFAREKNIDVIELYKEAMISRQTISKFSTKENYRPKRETVFLCAIGLKLNLEETEQLLASCGYAINSSSKYELIIQYFIESEIYDFNEIDTILIQYDQKTLRNYD
jgi:O-acetyl-ADP-ribose deacetylase